MSSRLYYVNAKDRVALFYGMFNSEPIVEAHPDLKSWLDSFGPARSYFMRKDTPPVYPWSNGNNQIDARWNLWIHYPGAHDMKPTGPWKAWPTYDLHALGSVASMPAPATKPVHRPKVGGGYK